MWLWTEIAVEQSFYKLAYTIRHCFKAVQVSTFSFFPIKFFYLYQQIKWEIFLLRFGATICEWKWKLPKLVELQRKRLSNFGWKRSNETSVRLAISRVRTLPQPRDSPNRRWCFDFHGSPCRRGWRSPSRSRWSPCGRPIARAKGDFSPARLSKFLAKQTEVLKRKFGISLLLWIWFILGKFLIWSCSTDKLFL